MCEFYTVDSPNSEMYSIPLFHLKKNHWLLKESKLHAFYSCMLVQELYTVDSPSFGKYSCILVCELYTVGSPDLSQSIAVWVLKYFTYFLMEKTTILDYDNFW